MSPLIVVVDNDEAIRDVLVFLAQDEGWTAFGYSYAEVKLATIQQINPDLIVLDFIKHRMGEGWEFLQLLKMEESTAAIPIIISTTTPALSPEIMGYLASRNISVVSKPFDVEEFISIARQALSGQSAPLLSIPESLPILLVEDNAALSRELTTILRLEGFLVTAVPNGQLALDAVRHGQHRLIFLDMQMPVMTGREFIAAYAQRPGPHTPTIILSAEADQSIEGFPSFVIGWLPKPFEVNELLMSISKHAQPA